MKRNCETFSYLEKDEKTYNHVKAYYEAMKKGINCYSIDCVLQKHELEDHLKRCRKEHDQEEQLNWINQNAEKFRSYINSLKTVALLAYVGSEIHHHNDFIFDLFCSYVDLYDKEKKIIVDTIRINE